MQVPRMLFVTSLVTSTSAFVPTQRQLFSQVPPSYTSLKVGYDPYSDTSGDDSPNGWKARTDFRQLLTQRSIQSLVFLLNQCHEDYNVRWLENQLDFKNIDNFHGTGAFNMTLFPEWDSFFIQIAHQDDDVAVVEIPKKKAHKGWAYKSSYLDSLGSSTKKVETKDYSPMDQRRREPRGSNKKSKGVPKAKPKWQPVSHTTGAAGNYLESLNQQAIEKNTDEKDNLRTSLKKESEAIRRSKKKQSNQKPNRRPKFGTSYLETLAANSVGADNPEMRPGETFINPHIEDKSFEYVFNIDPTSLLSRMISVREQISLEWKDDLIALVRTNEQILDKYELESYDDDIDESEESSYSDDNIAVPFRASQEEGKNLLYDRNAFSYVSNTIASQDRPSSPLRMSNLDLLLLLCTQESLHRVLADYKVNTNQEKSSEKHDLLYSFYKESIPKYFDGHMQTFGRGDDFLEALLNQSPLRETEKGTLNVVDPVTIVEDILRQRSIVAREWKSIADTIPDEHLDLRRILFSRHLLESSNWDESNIYGVNTNGTEAALHPTTGFFE